MADSNNSNLHALPHQNRNSETITMPLPNIQDLSAAIPSHPGGSFVLPLLSH